MKFIKTKKIEISLAEALDNPNLLLFNYFNEMWFAACASRR